MLFTEAVGKALIDANTQKLLGKITAVSLDRPSGICFLSTENNVYYAEKLTVEKNAVKAKNTIKTELCFECKLGMPIYDRDAKFLGEISDVEFSPSLKFKNIVSSNGAKYSKGNVYAIGDALLIRPKRRRQNKKLPADKEKIGEKTTPIPTSEEKPVKTETPLERSLRKTKRYGDFGFLVGKTVDKTIVNFQGEIMIKNGDTVTRDVLRQAKVSGKLVELCLHTK